jgi:hypothetical protein
MAHPGYQWWKVAQHLDEAQSTLASVMSSNLDDQGAASTLQDKLREGQAMLLEIFRANGLLPAVVNGKAEAPPVSVSPQAGAPLAIEVAEAEVLLEVEGVAPTEAVAELPVEGVAPTEAVAELPVGGVASTEFAAKAEAPLPAESVAVFPGARSQVPDPEGLHFNERSVVKLHPWVVRWHPLPRGRMRGHSHSHSHGRGVALARG